MGSPARGRAASPSGSRACQLRRAASLPPPARECSPATSSSVKVDIVSPLQRKLYACSEDLQLPQTKMRKGVHTSLWPSLRSGAAAEARGGRLGSGGAAQSRKRRARGARGVRGVRGDGGGGARRLPADTHRASTSQLAHLRFSGSIASFFSTAIFSSSLIGMAARRRARAGRGRGVLRRRFFSDRLPVFQFFILRGGGASGGAQLGVPVAFAADSAC